MNKLKPGFWGFSLMELGGSSEEVAMTEEKGITPEENDRNQKRKETQRYGGSDEFGVGERIMQRRR